MGKLLFTVLTMFASSAIRQMLIGAGIGLASSAFLITMFNRFMANAQQNLSALGDVLGLLGLCGADIALSLIFGAMVYRVTVASLKLHLVALK